MDNAVCWQPSAQRTAQARLTEFISRFRPRESYSSLHQWSLEQPDAFWDAVWQFGDLAGDRKGPACVPGEGLRQTAFFPQSRLSYAENLLRGEDGRLALIEVCENGTRSEWTLGQLRSRAAAWRAALAAAGAGHGDRIAAVVPNCAEAIAAMLGTQALGAIWCSCSPDFGAAAIVDRFGQVAPKILIAAAGYRYGGKAIDCRPAVTQALAELPSVRRAVVLPYGGREPILDSPAAVSAEKFLAAHAGAQLAFARASMDEVGFILFSSGTTGKPKCIAHSGFGLLVKHASELLLHADVHPGDRLFFFTTCGWMMWNWLASGLAVQATLVLYDGQPMHPQPARLADLAEDEGITHFGASAKYFDACSKAGMKPAATHRLDQLRTVLSTGSPLRHETFDYLHSAWKEDLHIASISGGTDICACFMGGVPTLPVRRGEIQAAELGCDLAVFSPAGEPVVGQPGELVCRNAIPSMPVKFWADPSGARIAAAYYDRFPGVWHHGDWLTETASGGYVIAGRSDATLNPGGVRIGTSEIYRPIEELPEIAEAAAVGQSWEGDERIILFVRLAAGSELTDDLAERMKAAIRRAASPRHVPARIVAVADLPRTRSGKIAELAIRDVVHGREVSNAAALANPDSLGLFAGLEQLQS